MSFRTISFAILAFIAADSAFAVTRSWTGATSSAWSEPSNWSPAGVPVAADTLVFPAGVAQTTMTNDLPAGTSVGPMNFRTSYTLNGNRLLLTGDLTFDQSASPYFTCNTDLTLGAAVRFGAAITSNYNGAIDVNGKTLTIDTYNTALTGAVNGSGSIVASGSGVTMSGGGTFSGTISGNVDVSGSMPNASIAGSVSGYGTIGTLSTTSQLFLGTRMPCCPADPHSFGTLHTKSASVGGFMYVDLSPAGSSDQLDVTGTVDIRPGAWLSVSVPTGALSGGQSFTIIANDGTDPVTGTFFQLPEGTEMQVGTGTVQISYHGGDGNDVVLKTKSVAFTRSWTGAVSSLWSDGGNWSPAGIPATGESLVFPAGATRTDMTNDLPAGTVVGALNFRTDYSLSGNPLTLMGDLSFDGSVFLNVYADLKLGADLRFHAATTSRFRGAVDVNGHVLNVDTYNTSFDGPLNGSGTVFVNNSGAEFHGGGSFTGSIIGTADIVGAMPNADVTGSLSGDGTAHNVTINNALYVGSKLACCGDAHNIGTLHTRDISLTGSMYVDIVGGGTSDLLDVTGTVTLSGVSLHLSMPSGTLSGGESYTIIANDGVDPISGTFTGLSEGAAVSVGGGSLQISYHGGDGNDVVLRPAVPTHSWIGTNSALWSDSGNWVPGVVPNAVPLLFPNLGASTRSPMINDLPDGTTVGSLDFRTSFTLNGNRLNLTGDIIIDQNAASLFTCNASLTLGSSVRFGAALTNVYNGTIDVNGKTLTIDSYNTSLTGPIAGSGSIVVNGSGISMSGGGTFSGTITGTADVTGSMPDAKINGNLSGTGAVGTATVTEFWPGSKLPCCGDPHQIGTLQTKDFTLTGTMHADIAGSQSDRVSVTGPVTLGSNSTIVITVASGSPMPGDQFTIIDNDAADPVSGTFKDLPEGTIIPLAPWNFRVSYIGGDGNDVTLTEVDDTATISTQDLAVTHLGETATFTATVTSRVVSPNGNVVFSDNGNVIGNVSLVNGTASLPYAQLKAGSHTLTATYEGTSIFTPSMAAVSHDVSRGSSATALRTTAVTIHYGDPVPFDVAVSPVAPAFGTPSGNVTIRVDGSQLATAALTSGGAAATANSVLPVGAHAITASYAGDNSFDASESSAGSVNVVKGTSEIRVLAAATEFLTTGTFVRLTLQVGVPQRVVPAAGVVSVSADGGAAVQQSLSGSVAIVRIAVSPGAHQLALSYLGDSNLEPGTATISYTAGTAPSEHARADMSGDGRSDLVLQNSSTNAIAVWVMNGNTIDNAAVIATPAPEWKVAATGDLDGDGRFDLVLKNASTRAIALWRMDGTNLVSGAVIATPAADWRVAAAYDFTGDGRADLILQNAAGAIAEWQMNGATITSGATIATPAAQWRVIGAAKFNGSAGIVLQNSATGAVARWLLAGNTITSGVNVATPAIDWKVKAAGDFNGDGSAELVLQSDTTNAVAIWTLSASGTLLSGRIIATPAAPWKVSGIADYDADGRNDIVLQNTADNRIAIWQTDGTTLLAGTTIATPAAGWKTIGN